MTGGLATLDRERLERFMREWKQLFDDGDYRRMAAFYTDDALLIAQQHETVIGRPAAEKFWRLACAGIQVAGLRRTVHLDAVESAGHVAYLRGQVRLQLAGASDVIAVRYVTVWRRERGGVWRIAVDISSPTPSASSATR
jgi:ketosteroid isomerase-like protein